MTLIFRHDNRQDSVVHEEMKGMKTRKRVFQSKINQRTFLEAGKIRPVVKLSVLLQSKIAELKILKSEQSLLLYRA